LHVCRNKAHWNSLKTWIIQGRGKEWGTVIEVLDTLKCNEFIGKILRQNPTEQWTGQEGKGGHFIGEELVGGES
jgi:hypothetical protein